MNNKVRLYPLGFIFSEGNINVRKVPEYYDFKSVLHHFEYYYDKETYINLYEDANHFIIIHGHHMHVGKEECIENTLLPKILLNNYINNYPAFIDTLDYIGGRFVVIIGNINKVEVYPDATNSRSTFFLKEKTTLSSHAHLLNDCFNLKSKDMNGGFKNTLLNTPFEGMGSTIPNYSLNLFTNKFKRFFPRENNKYVKLDETAKFELIESFWKKQLDIISKDNDNIILSLTGGGDSRTSLALIKEHLAKVKLFTYASTDGYNEKTNTNKILSIDNFIVKQMVNDLKFDHKFFYFDEDDKEITEDEKYVISKNSIARHSAFFVSYLRQNFNVNNLIHIRANLLEIGQAYLIKNEYEDDNLATALQKIMYRFKASIRTDKDRENVEKMFDAYIKETNFGESLYDYHILDILYWEIFMGRWYPEMLNTHDIACDTVSPYNHRALIDITLSLNYRKRKERYFQYELINRNFPVLNFYGLNNFKNLYEKNRKNSSDSIEKTIKIFDSFKVVNRDENKIISAVSNSLYIPKNELKVDVYSEKSFIFNKNKGILHLVVNSKFSSGEHKEFICYEILINNNILLREDVANWNIPNYISIKDLDKNDLITLRVRVKKEVEKNNYWENATKIQILEYREISSKMKARKGKVNFSSPYTTLVEKE